MMLSLPSASATVRNISAAGTITSVRFILEFELLHSLNNGERLEGIIELLRSLHGQLSLRSFEASKTKEAVDIAARPYNLCGGKLPSILLQHLSDECSFASFLFLRFYYFHAHADVLTWAVIAGCVAVLYALHHLEAFLHLAKYRILTIEERCTAKGGIGLHLLVGE